jgi:hypothetical protein
VLHAVGFGGMRLAGEVHRGHARRSPGWGAQLELHGHLSRRQAAALPALGQTRLYGCQARPTTPLTSTRQAAGPVIAVAHGSVVPPRTTLPAGVMVHFTLRSADGKPHKLRFPGIQGAINVPAHGRLSMGVGPYKPGDYPAVVDGESTGGRLIIRASH